MEWNIQQVCLIAIAASAVIITLIAIITMGRLFKTLKKVDELSSEIRERATESTRGFGYITGVVQAGFEFYELWKEKKSK